MKDKTTITVPLTPAYKVARGHQAHRGGAGVIQDKRTKRQRTRGTRNRAAIREW